jgi:nicotinate-nucleotide--dimethylbenzimidazole phosphoribosyltransferase
MSLLNDVLANIKPQDPAYREQAVRRLKALTMPEWALGRLMDLAADLAGITRSLNPPCRRKTIVVMAGDHGVAGEGVSKYPREVTAQMVANMAAGGAGVSALARQAGAGVLVVDMGVDADLTALTEAGKVLDFRIRGGTSNMAAGPAMSREEALLSVECGISVALNRGIEADIIGTGDMGIGNTTPSSAIVSCVTGIPVREATGRGTGIDDHTLAHKIAVIEKALSVNKPDPADGLDVLAKVGGFEIGGIAGLILGAASLGKPVVIDGFISTAGALIAALLKPEVKDSLIAAHNSVEKGHHAALVWLGKKPLLDLGLRLGEGTGAALAFNLVEAAVRILTEVATFEEAAVSKAGG